MYKTEAQIVSYGILYLNPSSHKCQPSYKNDIVVQTPPNRHKIQGTGGGHLSQLIASKQAVGATISHKQ